MHEHAGFSPDKLSQAKDEFCKMEEIGIVRLSDSPWASPLHMVPKSTGEWKPSDLSLISDWGRANLVLFNASKTPFLQLSTRHNLPDNYPLFFNDTQLPLSSTLNTFGLSFTKNLNCQFHISTLAKSAFKKLGILWRLRPFFSPSKLLALNRGLIHPSLEYGSHVWGAQLMQLF